MMPPRKAGPGPQAAWRARAIGACLLPLLAVVALAAALVFHLPDGGQHAEEAALLLRPGYSLTPARLGVEVHGLGLRHQDVPEETIQALREDVTRHGLLLFRNQGNMSAQRQVDITSWFGEVDMTYPYDHPAKPHPLVVRVSNSAEQGLTGIGRSGWHNDGAHRIGPYTTAVYHIVQAPSKGATEFVSLGELLEALPAAQRARWDRLWAIHVNNPEPRPLVYPHPLTGRDTMCFHNGNTAGFEWYSGTPQARRTSPEETRQLLAEVEAAINSDPCCADLKYSHQWQPGDVLIADNMALAHQAAGETAMPAEQVGLRIMHRTATKGIYPPRKRQQQQGQHRQRHGQL